MPAIRKKSPTTVKIVFAGSPDLESLNNDRRKDIDAFLIRPVNPEVIVMIWSKKLSIKETSFIPEMTANMRMSRLGD